MTYHLKVFEMMSYHLNSVNASKPTKGLFTDATYEIYCSEDCKIPVNERVIIKTDIGFTFPPRYCGVLLSNPELSKGKIDMINSVVNSGGKSIEVLLINNSCNDFYVFKGDKIALMLIQKYFDHFFMYEIRK